MTARDTVATVTTTAVVAAPLANNNGSLIAQVAACCCYNCEYVWPVVRGVWGKRRGEGGGALYPSRYLTQKWLSCNPGL